MHDPKTVAHEIYLGPKKTKKGSYRLPFITIWHVDPETDGTDNSCGWFIRLRHADKDVYEKIVREFESNWDGITQIEDRTYYRGWFTPEGNNVLTVHGIVYNMYLWAYKTYINPNGKISPGKAWDKTWKFLSKHYLQILYFSENNNDSMHDIILRTFQNSCNVPYTADRRMGMIRHCAEIIYTDILRKEQKWYQHPRWHIRHWQITFPGFRNFYVDHFKKCSKCGVRGIKQPRYTNWTGTETWCGKCQDALNKPKPPMEGKCPKDGRENRPIYIIVNNKRTLAVADGKGHAYKVYGEGYDALNSVCKPENKYDPKDYEFERGLSGMDF